MTTTFIDSIDVSAFSRYLLFLVPMLHAIWKIGCFMGGCCYGIEYSGIGAVVFPQGVLAPAGINLFPSQLLEAIILFGISCWLFYEERKNSSNLIVKYLIIYAGSRFITEFVRCNERIYYLTAAQYVSAAYIIAGILYLNIRGKFNKTDHVKIL